MRRALLVVAAVPVVVVLVASRRAYAQPTAHLRIAHLSPSTAAMDVYVSAADGGLETVLRGGVTYGEITEYEPLAPGDYVFSWRRAGSSPSGAAEFRSSTALPPGGALTLAALGAGRDVRSTLVVDDLTAPPNGAARVRLVNADETAGVVRVGVRLVNADETAGVVRVGIDDEPLFGEGAPFGTVTGYVTLPAGVVAVDISTGDRPEGIRTDLELAAGSVNTLVILESARAVGDVGAVVDPDGATVLDETRVLSQVVDAVSAPAAPEVGSIATGAGGTAAHVAGSRMATPMAVLFVSCLVAAGVLAAATRRPGAGRP